MYRDFCDNFATVSFYNNHLNSRTQNNNAHKRQQLRKHHHNFLFQKTSYTKLIYIVIYVFKKSNLNLKENIFNPSHTTN